MCGNIRESENAEQAVEFALAYAETFRHNINENYDDVVVDLPANELRDAARGFITYYTPATHRNAALALLSARSDDNLTTPLNYNYDVIT